ncbi:MAG: hypothetical protein JNK61_02970, partial [Bacteroidia bacterium]|nr:hypothetical protein [Bacteroidia bacterium]
MQTRFKFYPIKKNEIKSYSFYRSNVYKHARTAVYAFGGLGNATCVVNGTNPNIPFPLTSFGLQASDFINCHLGINSRSNANNIYNNIMSCIGGVKVVNSKYPYQTLLNNNFISASSYGIQLIDNKNSLQIMCNHNYVYMHPVLNTTKPAGYGIAAYENVINYNQINIHHNTIQCNSSTVGIYFYNTTQANTVHCNQIDTCRAGVHFTNNSDIGTQGSLTAAQENTWHFPTSNYFAFRNDLTCPNPTWYVRNGATGLPYKLTTIQKFPTSFVSLPYGTQVNDCEVPCPDCNNQRMAEIVTEQGSFATLSDEVKYQA